MAEEYQGTRAGYCGFPCLLVQIKHSTHGRCF